MSSSFHQTIKDYLSQSDLDATIEKISIQTASLMCKEVRIQVDKMAILGGGDDENSELKKYKAVMMFLKEAYNSLAKTNLGKNSKRQVYGYGDIELLKQTVKEVQKLLNEASKYQRKANLFYFLTGEKLEFLKTQFDALNNGMQWDKYVESIGIAYSTAKHYIAFYKNFNTYRRFVLCSMPIREMNAKAKMIESFFQYVEENDYVINEEEVEEYFRPEFWMEYNKKEFFQGDEEKKLAEEKKLLEKKAADEAGSASNDMVIG